MELFIAGVILGGLVSWLITHVYYVKSGRDQRIIYDKLTTDVRNVILQDQRDKLSVPELNALIDQRTIDPDANHPLPFVACPKCGASNLQRQQAIDERHDEMYYIVNCPKCAWHEWTQ